MTPQQKAMMNNSRWIDAEPLNRPMSYKVVRCSECHKGFSKVVAEHEYKFCPNCGADMRK